MLRATLTQSASHVPRTRRPGLPVCLGQVRTSSNNSWVIRAPATAHGHLDATTDPEQITAWFSRNPKWNLARHPRQGWPPAGAGLRGWPQRLVSRRSWSARARRHLDRGPATGASAVRGRTRAQGAATSRSPRPADCLACPHDPRSRERRPGY